MSKFTVHFNDYVSLAVMMLMIIALVAGQADARSYAAEDGIEIVPIAVTDERINIAFDGHIGDHAVELNLSVVTDLDHFRGEDE